jgi:hypothetical protein
LWAARLAAPAIDHADGGAVHIVASRARILLTAALRWNGAFRILVRRATLVGRAPRSLGGVRQRSELCQLTTRSRLRWSHCLTGRLALAILESGEFMTRRAIAVGIALALFANTASAEEEGTPDPNKPKRGTFDAGFKLRFPSGPDDMGEFGQFNFVALDLQGRYFLLDQLSLDGLVLLAPLHAEPGGLETKLFGGFLAGPTVNLDKQFGIDLKAGFLTEGAVLLSEKDAPIYIGDLKLAAKVGPWLKFKMGGIELNLLPQIVFQATDDKIVALQLPTSAAVSLGETLKVGLELGVYTGDDFDPRPSEGGRIAAGAAIDLKINHIRIHAGAGFATLLTDDMGANGYAKIGDSVYIDLNAKYVK